MRSTADRAGEMTLQPRDSGHDTQANVAPRRLTVPITALREQSTGAEIALTGDRRYLLGKGADCDIVLPDPCVSRLHCVLERHGDSLYVRDSGSRNGTYIDSRRVECAELTPGTVLTVGDTHLVALGPAPPDRIGFDRLIGHDPALRAALELARRAATTECSVLIVGETGTGKELVAQGIHETSRRAAGPFVAINCGAIPRELIGSELFGHDRGSFTGAAIDRDGVFAQADQGTLFLDELGELPIEQQPHLLRALETRRVRRIGSAIERGFDARIVAATNRDVGLGTSRGAVRVDLYHRVATVMVQLPPLRARPGDLDELSGAILEELAREHGPRRLSAQARRAMREHAWPGNVRELRQALMRAVTFSFEVIEPEHLFPGPRRPFHTTGELGPDYRGGEGTESDGVPHGEVPDGPPLPRYETVLRDALVEALERHGSIRSAAEALGMAKSTFADRARRFGLPMPTRGRR